MVRDLKRFVDGSELDLKPAQAKFADASSLPLFGYGSLGFETSPEPNKSCLLLVLLESLTGVW